MEDTILFPHSELFQTDFIVVPKRMSSKHIYEGYQTLVTYPTTFFKEGKIAGYLFFLLYKDAENRRSCHFSSVTCKTMSPEEVVDFIVSFSEDAQVENIVVECYRPPPEKGQTIFPYSEVLPALPGTTDISESLMRAGFAETVVIPCFEFTFVPGENPVTLHPYQNTEKELKFYWQTWTKRPEALKIKGRESKKSLFIENYLYNFPLFSHCDAVLFGDKGMVHWFPDVASHLTDTLEALSLHLDDLHIKRAKLFRVAGEPLDNLLEQAMQYINTHYHVQKFQLDNLSSREVVESLENRSVITHCTVQYERVIFSYPG